MIRECQSNDALLQENKQLHRELAEANSIINAIRNGEVDALLISEKTGDQVYVLKGADHIYRILVEEMQEGCAIIAADGKILFCNKNFATIIKTSLAEVINSSIYSLLMNEARDAFAGVLLNCQGSIKRESSLKTGDGFCVPVIISASNIVIENQTLACLVVTDLTEQRRSERFTQVIFNQTKEPIIVCDRQESIIQANPVAVALLGAQLVGSDFKAIPLFLESDGTRFNLSQALGANVSSGVEVNYRRRDGKTFNLLVNAGRFDSPQEDTSLGYVVILTDFTDKRVFINEMARLEWLNLVGEMAAGIGHEVRNPLTTVRGYLQMFQRKPLYADHQEQFATMIEELDRANAIITEFLSLSKNKRVDLKPGNLNGTIHALFPLLQAEAFRLGFEIHIDNGDIPTMNYDDKEIRQLILNLARNAMEAMEPGGIITIETSTKKDKIILAVKDTGSGIPKEVMNKLGTPFVTTKEGGTGLGLSVCYRIAERHDAKIKVDSSSKGTTFSVQFPVLETAAVSTLY